MQIIRCRCCNKKLGEGKFTYIAIKCPRCRVIHEQKAMEPPTAPNAQRGTP